MPQAVVTDDFTPNTPPGIDTMSLNSNGGLVGNGQFAQRLLASGGDLGALRTAAVLRRDEWLQYDRAIVQIARGRFTMVRDMLAAGMRKKLTNPLATMQLVWERIGDMDDAQIDMTGEAADIRDRLEFAQDFIPVPIIHKGFRLNIRHLLASRKEGSGLDVTHAEVATIKVVETIEKLFLTGNFSAGSGGRIYGVTTYPYRNTGTLAASWTTATAAQIFADVNAMIAALEAKNMYGPYGLYIPRAYAAAIRKDYDTAGNGRSIMSRLMEIEGLQFIKTNQFLPTDNVVMVQMDSTVMEVIDGISPRMVEWSVQGDMIYLFKVMAIVLPRIKRDGLDQNGLAHFAV